MEPELIIASAAIAAVASGVALLFARSKLRRRNEQTTRLREDFGPEYARVVADRGRSSAEEDLTRQSRAEQFPVRPLSPSEVTHYAETWTAAQAQFVHEPGAALNAAGRLMDEVIAARGYPTADFDQGSNALSVDHPRAVQDYRAAHDAMLRNQRNPLSTDDLRAAMQQCHSVFAELTGSTGLWPVPTA